MKTELTADAVIRRIGEMCEFTDCGARTLSQRVEPLIRSFESEIRAQCEAAKRENAELRTALKEVCVYGGHEITDLLKYKRDAEDYPHLAAWLRQQEVQG